MKTEANTQTSRKQAAGRSAKHKNELEEQKKKNTTKQKKHTE